MAYNSFESALFAKRQAARKIAEAEAAPREYSAEDMRRRNSIIEDEIRVEREMELMADSRD